MTTFVLVIAGLVGALTILALALPCEACRLRRERMKKTYAEWQAARGAK